MHCTHLVRSLLLLFALSPAAASNGSGVFHQAVLRQGPDSAGMPESFEYHGSALAAGDFDGDGFEDLAVGAPRDRLGDGLQPNGGVAISYGTEFGLTHVGATWIGPLDAGLLEDDDSELGASLAAGDFNGDGYDDLAVGAPGADYQGKDDVGRVSIFYGSKRGLEQTASLILVQSLVGGIAQQGEHFGHSLAAGSLGMDDGYDDLAIGAPGDVGGEGAISWICGSNEGLDTNGPKETFWPSNLPIDATGADRFGWSLSIGHHRGNDDLGDLVVGEPYWDLAWIQDNGRVVAFQGGPTPGIWPVALELYPQMLPGGSQMHEGALFGWDVAAGNFFGGPPQHDDLAVTQLLAGEFGGGVVWVLPIGIVELDPTAAVELDPTLAGYAPKPASEFGYSLASGDHDLDGNADLAIGAPSYDVNLPFYGAHTKAGMAAVFRGAIGGPVPAPGLAWTEDLLFDEPSALANLGEAVEFGAFDDTGRGNLAIGAPGKSNGKGQVHVFAPWRQVVPMPSFTSIAVDCKDNIVFSQKPFEKRYIASTTKIMTVLLGCEATQLDPSDPGYVAPSYPYKIPTWLAEEFDEESNCSKFVFEPLTTFSLYDLMALTMAISANDAAHAVAQILTDEHSVTWIGPEDTNAPFVDLMNARAAEIGMNDTLFTNPAGTDGGDPYSTAYDMYLLSREAMANPIFRGLVGTDEFLIEWSYPGGAFDGDFVSNGFANSIQGILDVATGIKGGSTPLALKTGCWAARGEEKPWGEAIVTSFGTDTDTKPEKLHGPAAELLELSLAECGYDDGGGNPNPGQGEPFHWDVGPMPVDPGQTTGVVGGLLEDVNEDVVLELHRHDMGQSSTSVDVVIEQTSSLSLEPGGSASFGLSEYESHDGIEVCYIADAAAPTALLSYTPANGTPPQTHSLSPGDCLSIPAGPAPGGSSSIPPWMLSNIGATACVLAVTELGYRDTATLGLLGSGSESWTLARDARLYNSVVRMGIEGLSGPSDATATAVAYPASSSFAYAPCTPEWKLYGQGWPGTDGEPYIGLDSQPVIGQTTHLVLGNSAGVPTAGLLLLGVAPAVLPTGFGGVLDVQPLTILSVPVPAEGLTSPWMIPNNPAGCGRKAFLQLLLLDSGASHLLSFSRGLEVTRGQ